MRVYRYCILLVNKLWYTNTVSIYQYIYLVWYGVLHTWHSAVLYASYYSTVYIVAIPRQRSI